MTRDFHSLVQLLAPPTHAPHRLQQLMKSQLDLKRCRCLSDVHVGSNQRVVSLLTSCLLILNLLQSFQ